MTRAKLRRIGRWALALGVILLLGLAAFALGLALVVGLGGTPADYIAGTVATFAGIVVVVPIALFIAPAEAASAEERRARLADLLQTT